MGETAVSRRPGIPVYDENPCWNSTKIEVRGKRITVASGAYMSDEGEVEAGGVHVVQKIDRAQFVKLYTREMKAIFELKPSALKVVQYLIAEIQKTPNADAVYLHWMNAKKYLSGEDIKISTASFHRAMRELLEKEFIYQSPVPNMFWINAKFFWNGDRYRFVRDYILES